MKIRAMIGILASAIRWRKTPAFICRDIDLTVRAAMRSDVPFRHYQEIRKLAARLGRWPTAIETVDHLSSLDDLGEFWDGMSAD